VLTSVKGFYKDGKVELGELPKYVSEARVIVTFLNDDGEVNLQERGIDQTQAAELRSRLRSIADDWERPEMDVYDEICRPL